MGPIRLSLLKVCKRRLVKLTISMGVFLSVVIGDSSPLLGGVVIIAYNLLWVWVE